MIEGIPANPNDYTHIRIDSLSNTERWVAFCSLGFPNSSVSEKFAQQVKMNQIPALCTDAVRICPWCITEFDKRHL